MDSSEEKPEFEQAAPTNNIAAATLEAEDSETEDNEAEEKKAQENKVEAKEKAEAGEVPEGRDPLLVLPPEMLHLICALLAPSDLARLMELSTGWREVVSDEALWRSGTLSLMDNKPVSANDLRVLLRAPCLGTLDTSNLRTLKPGEKLAEALSKFRKAPKLAFSFSSEGALPLFEHLAPHLHELELFDFSVEQLEGCVGSLTALQSLVLNVNDDFFKRTSAQPDNGRQEMQDPDEQNYVRALEALTSLHELEIYRDPPVSPDLDLGLPLQLHELYISQVTQMQLELVQRMPKLQRLDVDHDGSVPMSECPPLGPGQPGLKWLGVSVDQYNESADACMLSLVRAHAAGLAELVIRNDDPDMRDEYKRRFLVDKLQGCELKALRILTLNRKRSHKCGPDCEAQVKALTELLRHCGTKVECKVPSPSSDCDSDSSDGSDDDPDNPPGGPPGPPPGPQYINIAEFDGCNCVLCKAPLNR